MWAIFTRWGSVLTLSSCASMTLCSQCFFRARKFNFILTNKKVLSISSAQHGTDTYGELSQRLRYQVTPTRRRPQRPHGSARPYPTAMYTDNPAATATPAASADLVCKIVAIILQRRKALKYGIAGTKSRARRGRPFPRPDLDREVRANREHQACVCP